MEKQATPSDTGGVKDGIFVAETIHEDKGVVGDTVQGFPSKPGEGLLAFNLVNGKTTISRMFAKSPLKFIAPTFSTHSAALVTNLQDTSGAAWCYVIGHGGGLVYGDTMRVRVSLARGSTAVLTTQASTKVFQQRHGKFCNQFMSAAVDDGALLALMVDPVVPFANSRYKQRQDFFLAPREGRHGGGSLAMIDWYTCGRKARGERWEFDHYESVNRIYSGGKLSLHDGQRLSNMDGSRSSVKSRMDPFDCYATVVLLGPRTKALGRTILGSVRARQSEKVPGGDGGFVGVGGKRGRHPGEGEEGERDGLIVSASELECGGVVLRVAGLGYEEVETFLRRELKGLEEECGSEVFRRKYSMH